MDATISLREYLNKGKKFRIPSYQRGYVWGKNKKGETKDSVSYMLESLVNGYNNHSTIFVQGVTVSETDQDIVLIDGQQRTTFFYLLLKYLRYDGTFRISYDIRQESDVFLSKKDILDDYVENIGEDFQDIYFFKKTLRIINDELKGLTNLDEFKEYILDNIKFLYIDIPLKKEITVFSMMNGNKAIMKTEELIKAEMLRLASLNANNFELKDMQERNAIEWDNNMLRSRYAREWDKWLQWWNRDDVSKLFKTNHNTMGVLITTYQQLKKQVFSFANFRIYFLKGQRPIEAKRTFDGLRRLQKRFEDAFNDAKTYNKIGAIIRVCNDKPAFLIWYFGGKEKDDQEKDDFYSVGKKRSDEELDYYYKMAFLGLPHSDIIKKESIDEKFEELYNKLDSDNLYNEYPEEAFRLLLRLNIDEDNLQEDGDGRKFDFSIWDRKDSRGRSLEHIFPKSKVWHKVKDANDGEEKIYDGNNIEISQEDIESATWIERSSCTYEINENEKIRASEHSIGNLVLLYKDENSSFNNSSFEEKKNLFFNKNEKEIFKSRHLLHTIYKFAKSKWDGEEIAKNKYQTLKDFKEYYGK